MNIRTCLIIATLTIADPARAWDMDTFEAGRAVTVSDLSATLSHSQLHFSGMEGGVMSGNTVLDVMNHSTGVVGIVQNNGAQSNVQQAITVNIGQLTLPAAPN